MEEKRFNRLLERYKYSHEAVKELYEYYYPIIVRYINRQFRGEVAGQDVAQQFFLKLFQMKSYKIRAPNAWVRTVTRNIAISNTIKKVTTIVKLQRFAVAHELLCGKS